VQNYKRIIVK